MNCDFITINENFVRGTYIEMAVLLSPNSGHALSPISSLNR